MYFLHTFHKFNSIRISTYKHTRRYETYNGVSCGENFGRENKVHHASKFHVWFYTPTRLKISSRILCTFYLCCCSQSLFLKYNNHQLHPVNFALFKKYINHIFNTIRCTLISSLCWCLWRLCVFCKNIGIYFPSQLNLLLMNSWQRFCAYNQGLQILWCKTGYMIYIQCIFIKAFPTFCISLYCDG